MTDSTKKETAINDEQQSTSKEKIINCFVKILADNQMSIHEAKEILREASIKIEQQKVSNVFYSWVDANNIIK